ncbi:MAG: non-homologous end-joining DNA ligase [Acidimicrobiales bacterium]|nr:non-homologous end-joining DNA ligase [Acidimicrobiales bacterium]
MDWVEPMNATLTEARFDDADWIFERKLDGFRFLAFVLGDEAVLLTRNRIRHRFPEIEALLVGQDLDDFILDGEVVWGGRRTGAPRAAGDSDAEYCVFDILRLEGHDVTPLPLMDRKRLLREQFVFAEPLVLVEPLAESGVAAFERACAEGWEGVMAKRRDSVYEHKRSRNWLKMKCLKAQEFVIGGWTEPSGMRAGFGALLVGYHDGDDFVYAGKLGTGFNTNMLNELYARMRAIEISSPPFTRGSGLPKKAAHWVEPEIICDAGFMEWTSDDKLRHPKFMGLRDDKSARDVVRES